MAKQQTGVSVPSYNNSTGYTNYNNTQAPTPVAGQQNIMPVPAATDGAYNPQPPTPTGGLFGGAGNTTPSPTPPQAADPATTPVDAYVAPTQQDYSGAGTAQSNLPTSSQYAPDMVSQASEKAKITSAAQLPSVGADTANTGRAEQLVAKADLNDVSLASDARQRAETSIYDSMASRLDPKFAQGANDLEISLRNRGLSEGDAAFDTAMANFGRDKNDAYNQAQWQAIQGGGQEGERDFRMESDRRAQMYGEAMGISQDEAQRIMNRDQTKVGMGQLSVARQSLASQNANADRMYELQSQGQGYNQQMSSANYQNNLRQMQIEQEMLRRNQSLNELNGLLTGAQVSGPNFNSYNQAGNAGGVDYSGAASNQYNASMDAANINNAAVSNAFSGATSMASMFSDERLKENIVKVGEHKGLNIYTWVWNELMPEVFKRGKIGFGVIAQEVEKLLPSAVTNDHPSGFKQVKYSEIF